MDPELQLVLQDCLHSVNELLNLLELDDNDMPGCIEGEILEVYQKGLHMASKRVQELKQTLSLLQEGM